MVSELTQFQSVEALSVGKLKDILIFTCYTGILMVWETIVHINSVGFAGSESG